MFHGLSVKKTRELAWEYAKANLKTYPEVWDINRQAGQDWFYGLMKRNPDLSLRMPEATSIARATGFNRPSVGLFFNQYKEIASRPTFKLEPHRIWNLDETGVKTVTDMTRVLSQRGLKQVGQISSAERGVLVTMCCCINAVGVSLPPAYIFPRVNYKDHMLTGAPNGSLGLANPSGWMTSELFPAVLKHFIKHMNVSKSNPALLFMDNHESHLRLETIDLAKENGLIILTFPPHCSHKLQPLDVSVYAPFKRYYSSACNDWMLTHPGRPITIYDLGALSAQAYYKAFTPANITAGFNKTGIYPMNEDIFTDDIFLSSAPTDRDQINNLPSPMTNLQLQSSARSQPEPSAILQSQPSTSHLAVIESHPKSQPSDEEQVQSSVGSDNASSLVYPEMVRPFPKAPERLQISRKRTKSAIITDTPERNHIALEKWDKVLPKKCVKGLFHSNAKTNPEKINESSSDDEWEELHVPFQEKDPEPGDYVLVKFARKRSIVHYVGIIKTAKDRDGDYDIQFLRRSLGHRMSHVFVEPIQEEIYSVEADSVLGVLPKPVAQSTKRQQGIIKFSVNFEGYNME